MQFFLILSVIITTISSLLALPDQRVDERAITVGEYCLFLNDVASVQDDSPFYNKEMNLERRKEGEEYFYLVAPGNEEDLLENVTLDQAGAFYGWLGKETLQPELQLHEVVAQKKSTVPHRQLSNILWKNIVKLLRNYNKTEVRWKDVLPS